MLWTPQFLCNPEYTSQLSDALEEHVSAVSFFEEQGSDLWVVEIITPLEPSLEEFKKLLAPVCAAINIPLPSFSTEQLPDTDWLEATWKSFPPRQIGRYYVYGSHTTPSPPPTSVTLEINAATAFGSGEHETTTGCLLILDTLAIAGRKFQKPLDMGCGSGILAMAIAKTWNVQVVAADNDPECIRVTEHNATLNQCSPLIKAVLSEGFATPEIIAHGPYDLIVANILATPLFEMANDFATSLAPKGVLILSGLLSRHRDQMVKAYEAEGFNFISHKTINDWEALMLEKK